MKKLQIFIVIFGFIAFCTAEDNSHTGENLQTHPILESNPLLEPAAIFPANLPYEVLIGHLTGKFDYTKDSCFVPVAPDHCLKLTYLQKEVYEKFREMHAAAAREGVELVIVSGTRNFEEQKVIWERKWEKYITTMDSISAAAKILQFCSMPTTSRHHWGTDIDLNCLENEYYENGKGWQEYKWLQENAYKFGFYQVYGDKKTTGRSGYEMEKWHWSYIPLAREYWKKYNELIDYSLIKGFAGCELAPKLQYIKKYVNGIDESCR